MTEVVSVQLPGRLLSVVASDSQDGAADGHTNGAPGARLEQIRQEVEQQLAAERVELDKARRALAEGMEKLQQLQPELFKQAEEQLLDLSVDIARKILMQEIRTERYEIDPIVKEALQNAPMCRDAVVHLHPDDLVQCQTARQSDGPGTSDDIHFVADPAVGRAECLIETAQGIIESSTESQLAEISEALKKNPE